jgi:leader peptidase (prepilin peptidase)/N-methyltransferase
MIDIDHKRLPDKIVLPSWAVLAALLALASLKTGDWGALGRAGIGAAGLFALYLALALIYPAGMGMGDVKLAFLMGAALGRDVAAALMIGMFAALLPSIVLLARHGAKARKMGIPFGPFLALGSLVSLFAGSGLVHAYLSLF